MKKRNRNGKARRIPFSRRDQLALVRKKLRIRQKSPIVVGEDREEWMQDVGFVVSRLDTALAQLGKVKAVLALAQGQLVGLNDALKRSGYDVSPCRECGEPVVCLPDGLSGVCDPCHRKKGT